MFLSENMLNTKISEEKQRVSVNVCLIKIWLSAIRVLVIYAVRAAILNIHIISSTKISGGACFVSSVLCAGRQLYSDKAHS